MLYNLYTIVSSFQYVMTDEAQLILAPSNVILWKTGGEIKHDRGKGEKSQKADN